MSTMNYIATSDELTSVADAIRTKGGTSSPLVFPAGFVSAIEDIPTGGTTVEPKDVNFIDYDGTIVAAYTAQEFAALDALPDNPTHEGLTAQGWNWSLSDAKTYVASYGKLNVGQMYITDDGKTRIHIKLEDGILAPYLGIAVNGSAEVDWGDGSTHDTVTGSDLTTVIDTQHTYAAAGEYVIAIDVTGEAALLGNSTYAKKGSCVIYRGSSASSGENITYLCSVLKVEIGDNTDIGGYAFSGCSYLASISIPEGVTNIGTYSFERCYFLKSVTLPTGLTTVGDYAFGAMSGSTGNESLASVCFPKGLTSIGSYSFSACISIESVTIPDSVTDIGGSAFYSCRGIKSFVIPNSVISIGTSAFSNCRRIESLTIPNGITSITNYMISTCTLLPTFHIPDSVESIGSYAFQECSRITSLSIPNSVTSIGDNAFYNCASLTSVTIPENVTSIGKAFAAQYGSGGCYSLAEIVFKPITPATAGSSGFALSTDCKLYVPFSALAAYLSASNYPAKATYTYMGFATYNSGETLPTQDSTQAYNVTWYASKADALAQTNPITEGTGSEIYCRYAAV